jgi:EpsI family protein
MKEALVAIALKPMWKVPTAILVAAALMVGTLGLGEYMKPTRVMADELPAIDLETMLPKQFGDWRMLPVPPTVYDPTVEEALRQAYSQTLSRTYANSKGQAVLLAVAYGKNQNTWGTAAHRPEFCYRAAGFEVVERGESVLSLNDHRVDVMHLLAHKGLQNEPITYWVTLHDTAAVPGWSRKLAQVRYGLQGWIVDGFLMRLSSPSTEQDEAAAFESHAVFARDLQKALPKALQARLFGGN